MESVLLELETKLKETDEKMNQETDYQKIMELSEKRNEIEREIEEKNERWLELLEIQEQMKMNG